MNFADIKPFLAENHRAVVQTIQPNGAVPASISRFTQHRRRLAALRLVTRGSFVTSRFPPCWTIKGP